MTVAARLTDLDATERMALAGMIRVVVRLDARFTPGEQAAIQRIGDSEGAPELLWQAISDSARAQPTMDDVRAVASAVTRPEAQKLILGRVQQLAAADGLGIAEAQLVLRLEALWRG